MVAENSTSAQQGGRELWRLLKESPGSLSLSLALGLAASALSLSPWLGGFWLLMTLAEPAAAGGSWLRILLGIAAGTVAGRVLHCLSLWFSHRLAFRLQEGLRLRCGALLLALPLAFFSRSDTALLRDLIQEDIETLEDGIAHLVPEVAQAWGTPLFLLAAMFWLDWRMALASISTLVVGGLLLLALFGKGAATIRRFHQRKREMSGAFSEVVASLPTVRLYNQSDRALARAKQASQQYYDDAAVWMRRMAVPEGIFQVLLGTSLVVVMPLGLGLYHQGSLELSTLIFFLLFSLGLSSVLSKTVGIAQRAALQMQLLERIFSLLSEPQQTWPDCPAPPPLDYCVTFDNVSFAWSARQVLNGINLQVPAGQSLALVGVSGAGKSTLVRLVPRFADVTSGAVRIGGVDVRQMTAPQLSALVSCVFQDSWLFSTSISDNLRMARPEASQHDIEQAARAAQAHEFILALPQGYQTRVGASGEPLSGGQQQRLAIARAMLKDAPILILDEATAWADGENELAIQQAIGRLSAGRTVLVVAHRLHTLQQIDQIVVLHQGAVIESGTHQQLIARPGRYQRWWQLQQNIDAEENRQERGVDGYR